jgi:hypothetical protein
MSEKKREIDLNTVLETDQEKLEDKDEQIDSEEKSELSQEAGNIIDALYEYAEKHNFNAFFHVSFGAFDESNKVIDDSWDTYGTVDEIKISMEAILEDLKQQRETED